MRQVINCLKENNPLINRPLKKVSVDEGMKIATELFVILNKRQDGIGLAANQVGIDAQVAVVNVREPIILINPEIIEYSNEIPYYEGCLSFQGKGVHTKRYGDIVVATEQEDSKLYFSAAKNSSEGKGTWEEQTQKTKEYELRKLETVCVQHEIDHLNGKTIMDRRAVNTITNEDKIGRNEKVTITNGAETRKLKWKKAESLVQSGVWKRV